MHTGCMPSCSFAYRSYDLHTHLERAGSLIHLHQYERHYSLENIGIGVGICRHNTLSVLCSSCNALPRPYTRLLHSASTLEGMQLTCQRQTCPLLAPLPGPLWQACTRHG